MSNTNDQLNDDVFWKKLKNNITSKVKKDFEDLIKFILNKYGTAQRCNRFDIGNSIEFALADLLKTSTFEIEKLPNAKRIDIRIKSYGDLSIKYSSTANIKLHNSNNSVNKDMTMTNLLLLTSNKLYLITNENIKDMGIDIKDYLNNTGDGLALKRKLLTKLKKENFKYSLDIDLCIDKTQCEQKLCAETFFEAAKKEFEIFKQTTASH